MGEIDDTALENAKIFYLSDCLDDDSRPINKTNAVLKPTGRMTMNSRPPPSIVT